MGCPPTRGLGTWLPNLQGEAVLLIRSGLLGRGGPPASLPEGAPSRELQGLWNLHAVGGLEDSCLQIPAGLLRPAALTPEGPGIS